MADFNPQQPPQIFRSDPYTLRWYNELIQRVGTDSYTREELNNGVLDTRYYTETEIDALLVINHVLVTDNYALSDENDVVECRGTFSLTLHTPSENKRFTLVNSGSGNIQILGTIQGDANFFLYPNESLDLFWTGSGFVLS